ncbi:hypothetical protein [Nostoc sp.]|uniref:hypothetical protein n=1 Tax=Nostoc sp. TaxID=1180 RepID=UPI002FFB08A8
MVICGSKVFVTSQLRTPLQNPLERIQAFAKRLVGAAEGREEKQLQTTDVAIAMAELIGRYKRQS